MGNKLKKPTLDILDSIEPKYSEYQAIKPEKTRLKEYTIGFLLDKKTWDTNYSDISNIQFTWNEIKYSDIVNAKTKINQIPEKQGIYLFIVKPDNLIYDLPKYILYVGIAGASGSKRTLKERLRDYFSESQLKKRTAIETMIFKYYDNLYIAFSPVTPGNSVSLEAIEKSLIGFYGTHIIANKDDAPISLKPQQKAFNL